MKSFAWSATKCTKEFEKTCKKCLTNSTRCAKISKFAANDIKFKTNLSVPCKLNNVKTNYNTLDNLWIV